MTGLVDVEFQEMIGTGEAARIIGVSTQYLGRLAEKGELRPVRTSLGRLFRRPEVERLAAERSART